MSGTTPFQNPATARTAGGCDSAGGLPRPPRPLSCYTFNRWVYPPFWGKTVLQQLSPTSVTRRRQGLQTCFGGARMSPCPIRHVAAHTAKQRRFLCPPGDGILFVNGVVIPALSESVFFLSVLRPTDRLKCVRASARNCSRRIAGRPA